MDGGLCYGVALRLFGLRICIIKLISLYLCYKIGDFMSDFITAICDFEDDDARPLSERVNDADFDEAAWLAQATEDARAEGFADPERVARNYLYTLRHPFEERVPLEDVLAKLRATYGI